MNVLVRIVNVIEFLSKVTIKYKHYQHLHKSRKRLNALSDDLLKDIGVSRSEAIKEAEKYFWQDNIQPTLSEENKKKSSLKYLKG